MLEKLSNIDLPYPPSGATIIIYNLLIDQDIYQEYLSFNSEKNRIEFPMNKLTSSKLFWDLAEKNGHIIEGTNIHWKIDSDKFCFWLEE